MHIFFFLNIISLLHFSLANDSYTTAASTLNIGDFCKICHCGSEINQPLIAPCFCSGSLKFVHQECLQKWIKSSDIKRCELCKYPFDMQAKVSYKLRAFIKHCIIGNVLIILNQFTF